MSNRLISENASSSYTGMMGSVENPLPFDSGSNNFLTQFDFSAIEEMDPSISEGHRVLYDREIPFELRLQDSRCGPQEVGTLEPVRAKILVMGDSEKPRQIKLEITSENDLFFHYTHCVDESAYSQMQESQKLMVEFEDYVNILIKMLNSCIREPQSFLAVFIMTKDGHGQLEFIQNMEYKFVELLSCECLQSHEEVVRQHIAFRYNSIKSKLALMQARLQDISALVKLKNPSLLLQLQKAAQQQTAQARSHHPPPTSTGNLFASRYKHLR